MFAWLKQHLLGRQREIFAYWDGEHKRRADPIVIDRNLEIEQPDWRRLVGYLTLPEVEGGLPPKLLEQAKANQEKALAKLVALVRNVFEVKPFNDQGAGLSEGECLELLAAFVEFTGRLVEAAGPLSNSPAQVAD